MKHGSTRTGPHANPTTTVELSPALTCGLIKATNGMITDASRKCVSYVNSHHSTKYIYHFWSRAGNKWIFKFNFWPSLNINFLIMSQDVHFRFPLPIRNKKINIFLIFSKFNFCQSLNKYFLIMLRNIHYRPVTFLLLIQNRKINILFFLILILRITTFKFHETMNRQTSYSVAAASADDSHVGRCACAQRFLGIYKGPSVLLLLPPHGGTGFEPLVLSGS